MLLLFLADKVYVRRSAVREVADKRLPLLNEYLKVKNFTASLSFDPLIKSHYDKYCCALSLSFLSHARTLDII